MAISIDGLVSGLDSTGIITKLMELEKRPVRLLENKQEKITDKIAAWQEINTKLLALETTAQNMNTTNKFLAVQGEFTNSNTLQGDIVDITSNTNIASGSYSLTINQLATQHKVVSGRGFISKTTNTGMGSLTITKADGTSEVFTQNTLEGLKNTINASSLNLTARIINTSSGSTPNYRLQIVGDDVGADNAFTVSTWQSFGRPSNLTFSTTQQALDAQFEIDGISIQRTSNRISDVIEGVEFELTSAGSGSITFSSNTDHVVDNIEDFVDAYNDVMSYIKDQFTYNQDTKQTNPLFGNSTLLGIQMKLQNIVTGLVAGLSTASGWYTGLSQIGIKTDFSDMLSIDKTALISAIKANVVGVKNLFVPSASGTYSFVDATGATTPGKYDTQVIRDSSGNLVIQMRSSTGGWITLDQFGNFWEGPEGSVLEGFSMLATGFSEGDTGFMSFGVGIAELVSYNTGFITEFSSQGAIFNAKSHLERNYLDFDDQIRDLEERIKIKQANLAKKFAQLEVVLSQLKSQSDYLSQQLDSLPQYMGAKGK